MWWSKARGTIMKHLLICIFTFSSGENVPSGLKCLTNHSYGRWACKLQTRKPFRFPLLIKVTLQQRGFNIEPTWTTIDFFKAFSSSQLLRRLLLMFPNLPYPKTASWLVLSCKGGTSYTLIETHCCGNTALSRPVYKTLWKTANLSYVSIGNSCVWEINQICILCSGEAFLTRRPIQYAKHTHIPNVYTQCIWKVFSIPFDFFHILLHYSLHLK